MFNISNPAVDYLVGECASPRQAQQYWDEQCKWVLHCISHKLQIVLKPPLQVCQFTEAEQGDVCRRLIIDGAFVVRVCMSFGSLPSQEKEGICPLCRRRSWIGSGKLWSLADEAYPRVCRSSAMIICGKDNQQTYHAHGSSLVAFNLIIVVLSRPAAFSAPDYFLHEARRQVVEFSEVDSEGQ